MKKKVTVKVGHFLFHEKRRLKIHELQLRKNEELNVTSPYTKNLSWSRCFRSRIASQIRLLTPMFSTNVAHCCFIVYGNNSQP